MSSAYYSTIDPSERFSAEEDKRPLTVAAVQMDVVEENVEATTEKVCQWIQKAAEADAEIVLFPEFVLSACYYGLSYRGLATKFAETVPGPTTLRVCEEAADCGINVIVGIAERGPLGVVYDSAVLIDHQGHIIGVYRKSHVATPTEYAFCPGTEFPVFKTDFGNIGILICYDLEFPETARVMALKGAEILFHMVANWSTIPYGISEKLANLAFRSRALENFMPIVTCNRVGFDRDLKDHFVGLSSIINQLGEPLTQAGRGEEMIVGTIDLNLSRRLREEYPYFRDRKPHLYSDLCKPLDRLERNSSDS